MKNKEITRFGDTHNNCITPKIIKTIECLGRKNAKKLNYKRKKA